MDQHNAEEIFKEFGIKKENVIDELGHCSEDIMSLFIEKAQSVKSLPIGMLQIMASLFSTFTLRFLDIHKKSLSASDFNKFIEAIRGSTNRIIKEFEPDKNISKNESNLNELCEKFGYKKESLVKEIEESTNEIMKFIIAEAELISNLPDNIVGRMASLLIGVIYKFFITNKDHLESESFERLTNNFKHNINMMIYQLSRKQPEET